MSYFYSKTLSLSVSALPANSATQVISATEADISIFSGNSLDQIASSIGYPTVSASSSIITLESGWKYFLDVRLKCVIATPLTADARLRYVLTNTSDNILSSEGLMTLWRSGSTPVSQEKCCLYIDATGGSQSIKLRANKLATTSVVTLNAQDGALGTTFKSHILIKAWK
jgi:hypothetical protein